MPRGGEALLKEEGDLLINSMIKASFFRRENVDAADKSKSLAWRGILLLGFWAALSVWDQQI